MQSWSLPPERHFWILVVIIPAVQLLLLYRKVCWILLPISNNRALQLDPTIERNRPEGPIHKGKNAMLPRLLIAVLPFFSAACSSERLPDAQHVANLVRMNSGLADLSLEYSHREGSPGYNVFHGEARDSQGMEYDLVVHVVKDSVHWLATPRTYILSREEAQDAVRHVFGLTEVVLAETSPGLYVGRGTDGTGREYGIQAKNQINDLWFFVEKRWFAMELLDENGRVIRKASYAASKNGAFGI